MIWGSKTTKIPAIAPTITRKVRRCKIIDFVDSYFHWPVKNIFYLSVTYIKYNAYIHPKTNDSKVHFNNMLSWIKREDNEVAQNLFKLFISWAYIGLFSELTSKKINGKKNINKCSVTMMIKYLNFFSL
jgi:hypothetical protein